MTRARVKSKQHGPEIFLSAVILLLATLVGYWNTFDVPLVFDDLLTIQANSGLQFGDNLRPSIWATRPLLYLSFAINYALHGQRVWGYHFVNFLLHFVNGILVLLIATHLFRYFALDEPQARTYALAAAAFFLLHPVQTESVTYVSSRSELLSTIFYSLAFLTFIKTDERKIGFLRSWVVAIPFVLGLFVKETVISLPAALVAYDYLFLSEAKFGEVLRRWRFYVTFVAGGVLAAVFLVTAVLNHTIGPSLSHISTWHYFLTQLRVTVTYIRLLVFPVGLNLDYDFPPSTSPFALPVIASAALLVGLLGCAWYLRKRQPVLSFSIFWFFITLAPTSSFVPIRDVIFEHRLYLPLVGVSLVFPLLIGFIRLRLQPKLRISLVAPVAALLVLLCVATVLRNEVWRDDVRLWSDVVAKSPHKARPYNSLATIYFNRREFDRALEVAQRGYQQVENPSDRRAFQQLMGQIYVQMHRYEDAAAAFIETAKIDDKHQAGTAYNNIGVVYIDMANLQSGGEKQKLLMQAAEAFRKSAELDENIFFSYDSYVNVLNDMGKREELENELRSKLERNKDYRAYYGLGKLAFLDGDYDRAVQYFQEAIHLNSSQKLIFFYQAYALNQLKRRDEAIQSYLQTIRLDPLFVQARHNLALLYMQVSDYSKAIENFEDVLRLDPNYVSAHLNLAKIYINLGNRNAARDHLSQVLSIAPQQQEAAALWRQLGS